MTIGDLDLAGATVTRLRTRGTTIRRLDASEARLKDVDLRGIDLAEVEGAAGLRGATVSTAQLHGLAGGMAAALGIKLG